MATPCYVNTHRSCCAQGITTAALRCGARPNRRSQSGRSRAAISAIFSAKKVELPELLGTAEKLLQSHFFLLHSAFPALSSATINPIGRLGRSGGVINCLIATKTCRNRVSVVASNSSSRRASSLFDASKRRNRTNSRMISMLTAIAHSLLRTLDSMATPCSVNT